MAAQGLRISVGPIKTKDLKNKDYLDYKMYKLIEDCYGDVQDNCDRDGKIIDMNKFVESTTKKYLNLFTLRTTRR